METPESRASFVVPASADGVPSWVEDCDSGFVKNHSAVGVAELSNDN